MSRIYVFDAVGLSKLAVIYHDKITSHNYYQILNAPSAIPNKYLTTETCIIVAFDIITQLNKPKGVEALMRVVQYFFDKTIPSFSIERKTRAKLCADYGLFANQYPINVPVHNMDACFIAKELYPGATIVGDNNQLYKSCKVNVFEH